jgi:Kelch motif
LARHSLASALLGALLLTQLAGCDSGSQSTCSASANAAGCGAETTTLAAPPGRAASKTLTTGAQFSPRDSMAAVVFGHYLWVLGGFTPERTNELWYSADGLTWTQAAAPSWSPRNLASAAVLDGRVYLLGGYGHDGDQPAYFNDVYATVDGQSWETVTAHAPWGPRAAFGLVAHDGFLYVIGGNGPDGPYNDVWRSADGANWELVSAAAPWAARGMLATVSFRDRLWVIGGGVYDDAYVYNVRVNFNDVWSSPDGVQWTRETDQAAFSPRRFFSAFVHDDAIFVSAGFELDQRILDDPRNGIRKADLDADQQAFYDLTRGRVYGNLNDAWASRDGRSWKPVLVDYPFAPRHAVSALALSDYVFFIGGFGEELYNDVWTFQFY